MLVLSRKVGQEIRIGDNITLVVSKISGNRVKLGITAPLDVSVVRGEIPRIESEDEALETAAVPEHPIAFSLDIDLDQFMAIPAQPR